jgi:hypothetical protein
MTNEPQLLQTARPLGVGAVFDYSAVTSAEAEALRASADHIRKLGRNQYEAIAEIGRELTKSKERLPHGQFTLWLAAEFGWMTDRSAQRYMQLAQLVEGKSDTMSVLQPTTLYALAASSTPESVKDDVVNRIRSGATIRDEEVKTLVLC